MFLKLKEFFYTIKKPSFKIYIILVIFYNFFSIIFLYNTTSLNLGIFSIQSIIYCLNGYLFIFFVFFESISAFLDAYGLTLNFLKIIISNPSNLNFDFNFYILFKNFNYVIFFLINLILFKFRDKIFYILFNKKINVKKILFIFAIIIISSLLTSPIINKISLFNYNSLTNLLINKVGLILKGNILRNDNWYLVAINTIKYQSSNSKNYDFKFENAIGNYQNLDNIFVIINESYPNFKDSQIKNLLSSVLLKDLREYEVNNFKKNWSKNYGTLGAELDFFCDNDKNFLEFKTINHENHLSKFLVKYECWINKLNDKYKIYIHSYDGDMFNRKTRYATSLKNPNEISFFNEVFFKEDLKNLGFKTCETNRSYLGICENEILNKFFKIIKDIDRPKLVIYLTLENHVPMKINNSSKLKFCDKPPINLNPEFCTLFHLQLNFNKNLNNFIRELNNNDLLIFFSDTPPMYSVRDRIHFEDYTDVYFFKKKTNN